MGIAAARLGVVVCTAGVLMLAMGLAIGVVGEDWFANVPVVTDHLFLLSLPGPAACVLAGIGLALPDTLERLVLPPILGLAGILGGLAIGLAAPAIDRLGFVAGAGAVSLALTLIPMLVLAPLRAGWTRILVRIVGSWLIAIGVMLGGTRVIAAKPPPALPPPPPAAPQMSAPSTPPEAIEPPPAVERPSRGDGGEAPAP